MCLGHPIRMPRRVRLFLEMKSRANPESVDRKRIVRQVKQRLSTVALGFAFILTLCGNTCGGTEAQPSLDTGDLTRLSTAALGTRNEAAGAAYYLFREQYLAPKKTKPAKHRIIEPDKGGHGAGAAVSLSQSSKEQDNMAQSWLRETGLRGSDCDVYISRSILGYSIQAADLSYLGDDFRRPEFSNVRPLVDEIFGVYGNPTTNLGKLRVLRDWVARVAIHPHPPFHADIHKNTHVLPLGWDWAMFDGISEDGERWLRDSKFWASYRLNGYKMLNRLLNLDGTEAHPMMERIGPAEYRIKKLTENVNDPEVYRTVLCTYQAEMLIALAASISIHGILVSTVAHDTSAFYLPELAKWVYMDPTFNEDYIWVSSASAILPPEAPKGSVASPAELYTASAMGVMREVFLATKIQGPSWERSVYVDSADDSRATYLGDSSPYGWIVMGSNLIQEYASPFRTNMVMYDSPFFHDHPDDPITIAFSERRRVPDMHIVFPTLGVSIMGEAPLEKASVSIELASNWPYHDHFEISGGDGIWESLTGSLVLTVGEGKTFQVKSVDKSQGASTIGFISAKCRPRDAMPAINLLLLQ